MRSIKNYTKKEKLFFDRPLLNINIRENDGSIAAQRGEILPVSLRKNIHTLFGHGYRFSTERDRMGITVLTIQTLTPNSSSSSADVLLSNAEIAFQQEMSTRPKYSEVLDEGNHRWSVINNSSFIAQMSRELQSIEKEYEEETGVVGCTMS